MASKYSFSTSPFSQFDAIEKDNAVNKEAGEIVLREVEVIMGDLEKDFEAGTLNSGRLSFASEGVRSSFCVSLDDVAEIMEGATETDGT